MLPPKRLYLVTGKGGVGKTLLSLACAHQLQRMGRRVLLADFEGGRPEQFCRELAIPYSRFELFPNLQQYIALKLHSDLLARWIAESEFIRTLVDVVPGMSYLIHMGKLVHLLREDRQLAIVLDSPSSGHAMVMLECFKNYRQIFRSGILFNDITQMEQLVADTLRTIICHTPTQLSLSEGHELKRHLSTLSFDDTQMLLNGLLSLNGQQLPPYLLQRTQLEGELRREYCRDWKTIPYLTDSDRDKIPRMATLLEEIL